MMQNPFDSAFFIGYVNEVSAQGVHIHFPSANLLHDFRHYGSRFPGGNVGSYVVIEGAEYGFLAKIVSLSLPDSERKEITEKRFQELCLELQQQGANNINLVTPTHYVPQIVNIIHKIKGKELKIPIVYNTSSYENVSTIQMLDGVVDIYLADLKYYDDNFACNYSHVKDYFHYASFAICEMVKQVGPFVLKNNLMKRGVIVRILVLPGHVEDAKKLVHYLYTTYHDTIIISLMNQYTPLKKFDKYPNLNRKVTDQEYQEVIDYALDLGVKYAFIQEGETQSESFIPNFDCSKI